MLSFIFHFSLSMSGEVTVGGIGTSAFDTTSLHSSIHGAFPNAVLLEEHQVGKLYSLMQYFLHVLSTMSHTFYSGYCNLSSSKC